MCYHTPMLSREDMALMELEQRVACQTKRWYNACNMRKEKAEVCALRSNEAHKERALIRVLRKNKGAEEGSLCATKGALFGQIE